MSSPWLIFFFLGCYHGINPGMGWLFAVALGHQEHSARAVFKALPPIAIGHAASIAAVIALALAAQQVLPQRAVAVSAAALLFGFGALRLIRARHPRWVGMRVGFADLILWSFLMASGHGAGLMLLPVLLGRHAPAQSMHPGMSMPLDLVQAAIAVGVHTLGYLIVMTAVAYVVYARFGLAFLRTGWFNLDLLWAVALMISALVLLL
jgi:hypothetical protein